MVDTLDRELELNFDYFQSQLPSLMKSNAGEFALIRHQHIVALYDSALVAARDGCIQFPDSLFSVQKVMDRPFDLGFMSNGSSNG